VSPQRGPDDQCQGCAERLEIEVGPGSELGQMIGVVGHRLTQSTVKIESPALDRGPDRGDRRVVRAASVLQTQEMAKELTAISNIHVDHFEVEQWHTAC
jgi:hypothetical protein